MFIKSVSVLFLLLSVSLFAQSTSSIDVGGYVQIQAQYGESDGGVDDFLVPRARISLNGVATENVSYGFSIGASESPDDEPRMVNAYVDFNYVPNTTIRVGQALLPFGLEGSETIPGNPDIDRSTMVKQTNTFSLFRDRGIQIRGAYNRLYYGVAVVNGSGANSRDDSSSKDVLGQVRYAVMPNVKVGLSGHTGSVTSDTVKLDRSRVGLDAEWQIESSRIRGEYIVLTKEASVGSDVTSSGWYLLGATRFLPKWESVFRVEHYVPNNADQDSRVSAASLTLHYVLTGMSRLSASLVLQDDTAGLGQANNVTTQILVKF